MSSYCSLAYLGLFLPIVMVLYQLTPQKHRWKTLLAASYLFFWTISGKLVMFLIFSTCSIHHFGLWMTLVQEEKKGKLAEAEKSEKKQIKGVYQRKLRGIVTLAVLLHIGVLVVLKYSAFFGTNINTLLGACKASFRLPIPSFILPIGISFYTMQAVSYLFDVYRGTIRADRNLGRLALYMSFFPQIMEGPICRYSDTAMQLWSCEKISYHNMTMGMQRIAFGLMKKIVIADRLNLFIKNVFTNYASYDGGVIAVAMVCYTCQLYMEFSGTIDVVIGSAEIFGIKMPENFRQPFFSKSISEFWTRWHITLGAWFRDYVFYPLSMSKPLKHMTISARKHLGNHFGPLVAGSIALFVVWICNGLWHGAGWFYIFFGLYHFGLILLGNMFGPLFKTTAEKLHIDRNKWYYRGIQIIRTAILVNIGELFFRSNGLRVGLIMFKNMVTNFSLASIKSRQILTLGIDKYDVFILAVSILIVFAVSVMRERGIGIRTAIARQNIVVRWAIYYGLILFIVIFGAYGKGYVPIDPIYANF